MLEAELEPRTAARDRAGRRAGAGRRRWASTSAGAAPATASRCPYFEVADVAAALERVTELGGSVVHPGERWAICKDSEGSPFALAGPDPDA